MRGCIKHHIRIGRRNLQGQFCNWPFLCYLNYGMTLGVEGWNISGLKFYKTANLTLFVDWSSVCHKSHITCFHDAILTIRGLLPLSVIQAVSNTRADTIVGVLFSLAFTRGELKLTFMSCCRLEFCTFRFKRVSQFVAEAVYHHYSRQSSTWLPPEDIPISVPLLFRVPWVPQLLFFLCQ